MPIDSTSTPDESPGDAPTSRSRFRRSLRWARLPALFVVTFIILALTGCLERLAYYPIRGTPAPPTGAEEVWFRAEDGVRLHGWFLPARGGAEAARATILVTHGNAGNISNHLAFVEFLPNHEFNLFIFDYRGYGNSDDGRLRREYLYLDTVAAFDALRSRPDVDPTRIGLYCQSLGAVFGLRLMADRPEVGAAVVISPFTRWRDITASALGGGDSPGPISRFFARALMPAGYEPIDAVGKITDRPILLIHGTDDEIVPHSHSEAMLEAAGPNVRLRSVPGGDHNSIRWLDPDFDRSIVDFYREAFPVSDEDDR